MYKSNGLGDTDTEEIMLDPNTLKEDGTAALSCYDFSPDGSKLGDKCGLGSVLSSTCLAAYAISYSGSDWKTVFVRDVATGADLEDKVSRTADRAVLLKRLTLSNLQGGVVQILRCHF